MRSITSIVTITGGLVRPLLLLSVSWYAPISGAETACEALLARIDREVRAAGVRDVQDHRIAGFPSLRFNRLLASLVQEELTPEARREWLLRAAELGSEGTAVELANLPKQIPFSTRERIARCQSQLLRQYLDDPRAFDDLRAQTRAPRGYRTGARALGFYWLARRVALRGVERWHAEARANFGASLQDDTMLYAPPPEAPAQAIDRGLIGRAASRSALHIPSFTRVEANQLFNTFAPSWAIAGDEESDQPGSIEWSDGAFAVNTRNPVSYRYLTYVRLGGKLLPQLNYLVWFSERPKESKLDLYGGKFDGLIWRVTLDQSGAVLLFESVHPCGCYHRFYPSSTALSPRTPSRDQEPPLISPVTDLREARRVLIHLQPHTHYVTGISLPVDRTPDRIYQYRDYSVLRSLPVGAPGTTRRGSLFDDAGLVPGTERLERWILWPLGVPKAGSMRQRGHHLTAFIGERVFDDPQLLERLFEFRATPGAANAAPAVRL